MPWKHSGALIASPFRKEKLLSKEFKTGECKINPGLSHSGRIHGPAGPHPSAGSGPLAAPGHTGERHAVVIFTFYLCFVHFLVSNFFKKIHRLFDEFFYFPCKMGKVLASVIQTYEFLSLPSLSNSLPCETAPTAGGGICWGWRDPVQGEGSKGLSPGFSGVLPPPGPPSGLPGSPLSREPCVGLAGVGATQSWA